MIYLIAASLLWATVFGLIKAILVDVDATTVALLRIGMSFLAFSVFLRPASFRQASTWMSLGAIQVGLMYVLYIRAYGYLQGHEVALLTITTPLFVTMLASWRRGLSLNALAAAVLAVSAAAVLVRSGDLFAARFMGVWLMQASNFCFALGQVAYTRLFKLDDSDPQVTAWLYLGALIVPAICLSVGIGEFSLPSQREQWISIVYLGLVPTALGFFLWNRGARAVSKTSLAVTNNLKIPLGTAIAWLLFGEQIALLPFLLSAVLFAAAYRLALKPLKALS